MDFELVRCAEGDRWFPWNYGRKSHRGRIGMERFSHEPGLAVLNAVAPTGQVLGSCSLRVGYRHSEYLLNDDGYRYGAAAAGPAYFWPDHEACPWILVIKSFWVRPGARRNGIARRFAGYAQDIGLPTYLSFANKNIKAWFDRQFRPTNQASRLQAEIAKAVRAPGKDHMPGRDADFTVFVQAEASALLLWRAWHGDLDEAVGLDEVLLSPDRADVWAIDSGGVFEAGFSDSAYAEDRCFGYALGPWCDAWGPKAGPFDEVADDGSDEDFEAAMAAYAQQSCFTAGPIDGWIIDPDAMRAYASVRHFLRTLTWHDYYDINDAAHELFIQDLRHEPRGLHGFSALVSPIDPDPSN